jgi:hypothetical protein
LDATADEEILPRPTPPIPLEKENAIHKAFEARENPLRNRPLSSSPTRLQGPKAKSSMVKSPPKPIEKQKPARASSPKNFNKVKNVNSAKAMKSDEATEEISLRERLSPPKADKVKTRAFEGGNYIIISKLKEYFKLSI